MIKNKKRWLRDNGLFSRLLHCGTEMSVAVGKKKMIDEVENKRIAIS